MTESVPFENLLAKSGSGRSAAPTVAQHCIEVAACAETIVTSIGDDLASFFRLAEADRDRLGTLVTVCGLLHDVGKAGGCFQRQLQADSRDIHPFRHEGLSVAACIDPRGLGAWLAAALPDEVERVAVLTAVMGHHVRAGEDLDVARAPRGEALHLSHPGMSPLWVRLAEVSGSESAPAPELLDLKRVEWEDLLFEYSRAVRRMVGRETDVAGVDRIVALAACCKAVLIAADTAGSARFQDALGAAAWTQRALEPSLDAAELDRVVVARLGDNKPYPFQRAVAAVEQRVTLVEAGCGNGKTLAAYLWARRHAEGRRLMFCYPTTGTTSAGFQDYLLAQTELERALMHSRASADIEQILSNGDLDEDEEALWAADVLDAWGKKVVACTVDSVLSLLACWRRALAATPLLARSAFVFDEVHSYDEHLFGAFLAFLRRLRAPCLIMTASLSDARRDAITAAVGSPVPVIHGDPEMEGAPRYELRFGSREDAEEAVADALERGEKVLWVANTVRRATEAFDRLVGAGRIGRTHLYHSRFRYDDRVRIQDEVIGAFREDGPALVVATQVCEMSLDISASLLVTELAPFPSLVQRLGRLNRRARRPDSTCPAIVVTPPRALPYTDEEMDLAAATVSEIAEQPTSQRDLAARLARMQDGPYEERTMPLLSPDDIARTEPGMLRSGSMSVSLIREEDAPHPLSSLTRAELVRLTIPMLYSRDHHMSTWARARGTPVAPAGTVHYDPIRGARWNH